MNYHTITNCAYEDATVEATGSVSVHLYSTQVNLQVLP